MSDGENSVDFSDDGVEEAVELDSKLAECLQWSTDQVGDWIESIGFPIYRMRPSPCRFCSAVPTIEATEATASDCFVTNCITGRRLILIDASSLPRIGIYDFDHIKTITQKIRELLTIELMPWNRSIALPPKEILAMFLEGKCTTGKRADKLTFGEFTEQWENLKFQPPLSNFCSLLPKD